MSGIKSIALIVVSGLAIFVLSSSIYSVSEVE